MYIGQTRSLLERICKATPCIVILASLCGCANLWGDSEDGRITLFEEAFSGGRGTPASNPPSADRIERQPRSRTEGFIREGSDIFVGSLPDDEPEDIPSLRGPPVSVNFVNTEIQEFARALFNDVLGANYVIDPGITGTTTVRTQSPISRVQLYRLAQESFAANGASLRHQNGIFRISRLTPGQQQEALRLIRVRHIDAARLADLLKPIAPAGMSLIADSNSSAIIVRGGSETDVASIRDVAASFDVDQMAGMSLALIPLRNLPATTIVSELEQILSASGQTGTRILAISRINAILVVARKRASVGDVRTWISRLDQQDQTTLRSYIYSVQNRRAEELAEVLRGAFLDPGANERQATQTNTFGETATAIIPSVAPPANQTVSASTSADPNQETARITADSSTNSLIIYATPDQYKAIRAAIHRLDVVPLQVLIEATIAEVRLNDSLRHGIRWFFRDNNIDVSFTDDPFGSFDTEAPGFNFVVSGPNGRLVLSALENETDVEIISTPSLTVLDNQTAKLQVGDQVPIATRTATSVESDTAPVVNSIELKDTGIILSVTPRVNASGVVVLDIIQEASDVVPTTTSDIDSPTIRQRKIESAVAVPNGYSVILGGLISTANERTESGMPIVKDIPVVGNLFKRRTRDADRTELLIIIRPVVIRNNRDFRSIAAEFQHKMRNMATIEAP